MASALAALNDGADYQARLFWSRACDLFDASTHVVAVTYEEGVTKSFDDVVVHYDSSMIDEYGAPLTADHFQVKFHSRLNGVVTLDELMAPSFIYATRYSILERLRDAYRLHGRADAHRRFILMTPWGIDPHDPLASMFSLQDEFIHIDLTAAPSSHAGQLRTQLLDHLQIEDVSELRTLLRVFRLQQGPSLPEFHRRLNERFSSVGLMPVEAGRQVHPYDDLARRVLRNHGTRRFTREDIIQICKRERLWRGPTTREEGAIRLGIRSFGRRAERLSDETDACLDLLHHFDGRFPKNDAAWADAVLPAIEEFLGNCVCEQRYHLHLHTHASIAFAVGYCLDPKAGIDAVPVQRSTSGLTIWRPALNASVQAYPPFTVTERPLAATTTDADVAIAIGATIDILHDVEAYVRAHLPTMRRIITFTPQQGAGPTAILDGTHAQLLARQVVHYCRTQRTTDERSGHLHTFPAAPNGLLYFLGQLSRGLGQTTVYEYNFEVNAAGDYRPALTFPHRRLGGAR